MRRELVPVLRHDRHVAELRQQRCCELVDLRRGHVAPREDAEVHQHFTLRRMRRCCEGEDAVEVEHALGLPAPEGGLTRGLRFRLLAWKIRCLYSGGGSEGKPPCHETTS